MSSARAAIEHALAFHFAGEADMARSLITATLRKNPMDIAVRRVVNDLFIWAGLAADGLALLSQDLPPITPETIEYHVMLARTHREMGDWAAALAISENILAIQPDYLEAKFEYGLAVYHTLPLRGDTFGSISVCLPCRFTHHPITGEYWLARAVRSIRAQTIAAQIPIQICVGIDAGTEIPPEFQNQPDLQFCASAPDAPRGQGAAVNAAASIATGDIIAFLEDDDTYRPRRLETALALLQRYDFVGCTQTAMTPAETHHQVFDYTNPTTWVMRRSLWQAIGPMDTTFRYHLDAEWLGRLNKSGARRVHQVDKGADTEWYRLMRKRQFYKYFYSVIPAGNGVYFTDEKLPLATKTVHEESISDIITKNPEMQARSDEEHARMEQMYDGRPF